MLFRFFASFLVLAPSRAYSLCEISCDTDESFGITNQSAGDLQSTFLIFKPAASIYTLGELVPGQSACWDAKCTGPQIYLYYTCGTQQSPPLYLSTAHNYNCTIVDTTPYSAPVCNLAPAYKKDYSKRKKRGAKKTN